MLRSSWFNYATTAPAARAHFDELNAAIAGDEAFLVEADELGLEVNRFHYLQGRVEKARDAFRQAGGDFGGFQDGTFVEPRGDNSLMENVIDRQILCRLHVLSMLEAREEAREAKAAKEASKAAEKAAKAAARAAI